jgi:hypothetical protein
MGMLAGGFLSQGGLLNFSPTYNGAQSPTTVCSATADYEYANLGPGSSSAEATADVYVVNEAADSVIKVIAFEDGGPTDQGSSASPATETEIFNLNIRPDTVAIRLVEEPYVDSDHANYPSTTKKIGTFTDDSDFDPTNAVKYGYQADASVDSSDPPGNPPRTAEDGQITPIVEFTFKKAGYNELVVTYKVFARGDCESGNEA